MTDQEIIEKALRILKSRLHKPDVFFTNPVLAKNYLVLQLGDLEYESFHALLLNSKHGLIHDLELSRGTIDQASVFPREVVKAALSFNAAAMVLAHNHPSGVTDPSAADKSLTENLVAALNLVGVRVLDHIIVGGDSTLSFAERGLIPSI